MRSTTILKLAIWSGLVLGILLPLNAQSGQANKKAALAEVPQGLPSDIRRHVDAVGLRLTVPGKEQSDYVGELTDNKGGKKQLHVTQEVSGAVEIEDNADPEKKQKGTSEI